MSRLSNQVHSVYKGLADHLIPRTNQVNSHIKQFLERQYKDFTIIDNKNDQILDNLRSQYDQYSKLMSELKSKKTKDTKFMEGGPVFLKAKDGQITAKKKILESISTGLKESVSKVKPQKLAKLPYQKQNILKQVFSTLYHVLYNQPVNTFDWKIFKQKALLYNNGQDLITRMANINFKQLSEPHHDALLKLKTDQKFKDVCQNSEYAFDIVDVADWVDYTVQGFKVNEQKKKCESEYDKINKDLLKRKEGTGTLKEQFCAEAMKEFDLYQGRLMQLQGQLKNITIQMSSSLNQLRDIQNKRRSTIEAINAI